MHYHNCRCFNCNRYNINPHLKNNKADLRDLFCCARCICEYSDLLIEANCLLKYLKRDPSLALLINGLVSRIDKSLLKQAKYMKEQ